MENDEGYVTHDADITLTCDGLTIKVGTAKVSKMGKIVGVRFEKENDETELVRQMLSYYRPNPETREIEFHD